MQNQLYKRTGYSRQTELLACTRSIAYTLLWAWLARPSGF